MQNNAIKIALIDGYLDEPSALGVPPYISPHIRYTYGALTSAGIDPTKLDYYTIDNLRQKWSSNLKKLEEYDVLIIIAGTTVPGHYLGGQPISVAEIKEIGEKVFYPQKVLGGPITLIEKVAAKFKSTFDHICQEVAAFDLYHLLSKKEIPTAENKLTSLLDDWAVEGAQLASQHPGHPHLIAELETFRGCPRSSHCAFCSERLKKLTYTRQPASLHREVKALAEAGIHHFRLGCQTDLLLYGAQQKGDKFIPSPDIISDLYQGIREADPALKTLHMDNINPAGLVRFPEKGRKILETIVKYNTTGDIAAFGLESADPLVVEKNNIDTDPATTFKAIEMINEIGGKRKDGIPALLPGLNFLHGLIGERPETMEYNYQYLKKILEADLMLRRINIRQVVTLGSYPEVKFDKSAFFAYKKKVNEEINKPMLQRVFPRGTVLKNVRAEKHDGNLTFGRQLGTYPILVGIPGQLRLHERYTVKVIDHGYRSITALPYPFSVQDASRAQLTAIPGIGKKRAEKIILHRPDNLKDLAALLGSEFPLNEWESFFNF